MDRMRVFPAQLVDWSGNRSGGVRRFFDDKSGRPSGEVIQTSLLDRLHGWARSIAEGQPGTPRAVLLVGGPGNGKTEAIESTIMTMDEALGVNGKLAGLLRESYFPPEGQPVPRLAHASIEAGNGRRGQFSISVVQDASTVAGSHGKTAAQLLLDELKQVAASQDGSAYLCCVNRGILDDALIEAAETGRVEVEEIIEAITAAISVSAEAPSCWPMQDFPEIAVWPMDAETLFLPTGSGGTAPARVVFDKALDASHWEPEGRCAAGPNCPFCGSRSTLSSSRELESLLSILRWHEVGTGMRWSFRDLFSLASYLLAGHLGGVVEASAGPCDWAATQLKLDERARQGERPSKTSSTAIFQLVSARYQHALFHGWETGQVPALRKAIGDLDLKDDNTARGLLWFLESRRVSYLPTMISDPLEGLSKLLDPALTDPNRLVELPNGREMPLRDIDARFSRSVREGIDFLAESKILSEIEEDLLTRLGRLEEYLSKPLVRRKRPATATSLQRFLRDFACRVARRSIGCRLALVPDGETLEEFRRILEDSGQTGLYEVAREVEGLLNEGRDFEISLTTTFGQPMPPSSMRATLVAQSQPVDPYSRHAEDRPRLPISFLKIGDGQSSQPIALTYELFKAMKELERGMSPASLAEGVLALLDTAKARLAGPLVRDERVLDRAYIRMGNSKKTVTFNRGVFATSEDIRS